MSDALRNHFLGWQCRIRQNAIREEDGRPPEGGCPDLSLPGGTGAKVKIVTLINKADPKEQIAEFAHLYKKQTEPNERLQKIVQTLSAAHYQQPKTFSEEMTALFVPGSSIPEQVLAKGQAFLEFQQYNQSLYHLLCDVRNLACRERRLSDHVLAQQAVQPEAHRQTDGSGFQTHLGSIKL